VEVFRWRKTIFVVASNWQLHSSTGGIGPDADHKLTVFHPASGYHEIGATAMDIALSSVAKPSG